MFASSVCERQKNGVTSPVGAFKVFLRLRCFARCYCVSLTHTHTHTCLSYHFHPVMMICGERFFMPCQHAWQPPQQHPQHHNRRLVMLQASVAVLLSFYAPESLPHCIQTCQDFAHNKATFHLPDSALRSALQHSKITNFVKLS